VARRSLGDRAARINEDIEVNDGVRIAGDALRLLEQLGGRDADEMRPLALGALGLGMLQLGDPNGIRYLDQSIEAARGKKSEFHLVCLSNAAEVLMVVRDVARSRALVE
jgi:hypothetical protein